ncbi:alpha/beta fold hydrolase [Streptomyces coelicoflavus]|uniref:alpha/beta fold hydrolase n=1 Tax=Streptomyces coelicoflavus TaxID=285562 RepID=UPI0024ACC14B|nr:alpha/beta fold hydrolase [Streptomyces coelicoflavus]MDI6521830.1 alpha/beta fold hydrolase [Streptomyces coelicoflavus]
MPPSVKLRRATLLAAPVMLSGLMFPSASAVPQGTERLEWRPCASVAANWPLPGDTRTECARLSVPLDYSKPHGRRISLAVSRIRADGPERDPVPLFYGSGGPGLSGVSSPARVLETGLKPLAADHDILGIDERGTGYSDRIECEPGAGSDAPATAGPRDRAKAVFDTEAEFNRRCVAKDPEFVRQLTPANTARDIDSFRRALGASEIDFYGVSFSTAAGMAYRSLFDHRVHRMWLGSVMPPVLDHSAMDGDIEALAQGGAAFVRWLARHDAEYHLGTDSAAVGKRLGALRNELDRRPRLVGETVINGDWVAQRLSSQPGTWVSSAVDLVGFLEGGTPDTVAKDTGSADRRSFGYETAPDGLNALQYNAMLCNADRGGTGFSDMWGALRARRASDPAVGGSYFSPWCAEWPVKATATPVTRGHSPLQISGHKHEDITPHRWAREAQKSAGGFLLTVQDDVHGSLPGLPCVSKVLEFFRNGRTSDGTCPGLR